MAANADDRDLLVSAQTGSGKTVAFGLAFAKRLLGEAERAGAPGAPRVLIVTPTRELALQVHRELAWLYAETGVRIATCVGGMDPRREQQVLGRGVHVVVGTPGRLCDHLERGALGLVRIETIVLDEADEMLDMGFREDLERLLDATPSERRTLMFSATIPKPIAQLAKRYQRDALRIATVGETDRHRDIEYHAVPIVPRERDLVVVNLLRFHDAAGALVFCATRDGVTHLAANLSERGFSVAALSGELSQRERNQALQALRDRRARVCVATDVAARGLDLPDLGLVIHADLPQNPQVLVHRSGRTGRAGRHGLAIVIVPDAARRFAERMLAAAHVTASWRLAPSAEEIRTRDRGLLADEIRRDLAPEAGAATPVRADTTDDDREVARALLADVGAEDLVAALVRSRRESWPAAEELTIPPSMRPRAPAGPTGGARPAGSRWSDAGGARPAPEHPRGRAHEDRRGARDDAPRPKRTHAPAVNGGSVWFTINVGRSKNADPKWLIPLLCRRGDITKRAIGKIQILARETRVEISGDVAGQFAIAIRRPDTKDRQIHIEPVDAE
jgi:ATP-dependent RNA helicase DeaD